MRKVKEYIEEYKDVLENGDLKDEEIIKIYTKILSELVDETVELSKSRKVGTASAIYSILEEQNRKWHNIHNQLNIHDSYKKMYLQVAFRLMPKTEEIYNEEKERLRKRKEEKWWYLQQRVIRLLNYIQI